MISSSFSCRIQRMIFCTSVGALGAFDDQRQLLRRGRQLDRVLGRRVLRAVDDVRPVDQVVEVGGVEAERSLATVRMKLVQERKLGS